MHRKLTLRRSFCASVLAALLCAGCRTAPAPASHPDYPRLAPGVDMRDVNFYSAALRRRMNYRVFLPATVASGRKLPVVYLLHGNAGGFRNWSNYSDVSHYAAAGDSGGLILVMPQGDSSYYVNAALKPEDRYEDYLVSDLIRDVEARFPAANTRESRAIVGVSAGGFAAVKLALTRPDFFVFAGALSPAVDAPSRRFTLRRVRQWVRFRNLFGPAGSQARRSSDPFALVQSVNPAATPYIYLTAGEQEGLLGPIGRLAAGLHARNFAYEFHTGPGGHDWKEWDEEIPGCFESLMLHVSR